MGTDPQIDPASFRDPSGFVFRREGVLYRQVNLVHREHFDRFLESGLSDELVRHELLIPHEDVDPQLSATREAYRVLRPEHVGFVSYPYEWSFEMLRDAALLTLRIQEIALDHGMSLRDATAYNVTFNRGKPVFLDTTSFEILPGGRPWVAYRQFCQHFLAPLALMAYRDVRLGSLMRADLDGIPLDLASELLPARTRAKPGLTMHVRMHARSQRRHETPREGAPPKPRSFSTQAFRGLLGSLRSAVEGLPSAKGTSVWRNYYAQTDHYSPEAAGQKESVIAAWVDETRPTTLWDLGANTGRFASIASGRGVDTVAFDVDPFCVDEAYRTIRSAKDERLLPLVQDLTNPSGGIGWAHEERASLEARGPADVVMALALIHHLAIANNVPLPSVCDFFARLGQTAIVEFVPKDDPKVQLLLRDREDIFPGYTQEGFERAASTRFTIERREPLQDVARTLYLLRRR